LRLGGVSYRLGRKIGSGAYADVHIATNVRTGAEVAIKLEPARAKSQQLVYEAMLCRILAGGVGISDIHWYGVVGDLNALVMDLLGPSLEDLVVFRRKRGHRGVGLRRTVALGLQVLDRIEFLHSKNLVHRDIKPENFLLGLGAASRVHVIDFGLSKRFRDPKTQQHVSPQENAQFAGNLAFSSVASSDGQGPSRRDDVEALAYMLVYMLRGKLPWLSSSGPAVAQAHQADGLERRQQQLSRENRLTSKKNKTTIEALCKRCPDEFVSFVRHCRGLNFEEQPDYAHLRGLLRACLGAAGAAGALLEGQEQAVALEWWLADDTEEGTKSKVTRSSLRKQSGDFPSARGNVIEAPAGGCDSAVCKVLPALLGSFRRGSGIGQQGLFETPPPARAVTSSDITASDSPADDGNPVFEVDNDNPVFEAVHVEEPNPVIEAPLLSTKMVL